MRYEGRLGVIKTKRSRDAPFLLNTANSSYQNSNSSYSTPVLLELHQKLTRVIQVPFYSSYTYLLTRVTPMKTVDHPLKTPNNQDQSGIDQKLPCYRSRSDVILHRSILFYFVASLNVWLIPRMLVLMILSWKCLRSGVLCA